MIEIKGTEIRFEKFNRKKNKWENSYILCDSRIPKAIDAKIADFLKRAKLKDIEVRFLENVDAIYYRGW